MQSAAKGHSPSLSDRSPVDLAALPDHALLTMRQVHELTGFALITLKVWGKQGRGPHQVRPCGVPRYMARDVREWIEGERRDAA